MLRNLLLLGLFLICSRAGAQPRLFIEDNDFLGPGGSDIQSVLPLITNPGIRVLGFTVVTGDGWRDEEASYLLRFLEIARRTNLPVYKGAVFPLINTPSRMAGWEQLYGGIPWKGAFGTSPKPDYTPHPDSPFLVPGNPAGEPSATPAPGSAVDFLIAQLHRFPHQVTILAAGPLTNLALAVRIDPDFASLAKELVVMGGMLDTDLPQITVDADLYSDFNFLFDPEAAHIVLNAAWPKITVLGEVTNESRMTDALAQRIHAVHTPVTDFIAKYHSHLPLWDEMAAEVAVDPSLARRTVTAIMDVDTDFGMHYGRARIWPAGDAPAHTGHSVVLVQSVDIERFYAAFIKAAQAPVP